MNALKKSILYRFIFIIAILAVWITSTQPLKDQDFYETFRKLSKTQDATLDSIIEAAKAQQEADAKLTPLKAMALAANSQNPVVQLREYVEVYNQPEAGNLAVSRYVYRKSRGKIKYGIDLQGGTEFIVAFDENELGDIERSAEDVRDEIIEILRNRIDQSGLVEAQLKPTGPTTLSVVIPSVKADDVAEFKKVIEAAAKLQFRVVHKESDDFAQRELNGETVEVDAEWERMTEYQDETATTPPRVLWVSRIAEKVRGDQLSDARPSLGQFGGYEVQLSFNSEGTSAFCEATTKHTNERMAIVLDGTVYSAPNINEPICGGRAVITGDFTAQEATQLAVVLRCGSLPVDIRIESTLGTDPTLGEAAVDSGIAAASFGMLLVIIFMVIYYRTAGFIANIALVANIVLILGTLTIAGATVTLPGIAGIILTIGMAVDANVLIFERIREELANNKSVPNAIKIGYSRAFVTIMDANITTFLTGLILYNFGSGPIRGFAVTLMIGIIASLFTALFVTRTFFDFLLYNEKVGELKMMSMLSNNSWDFLDKRKLCGMISAAVLVISVGVLLTRGANSFSVDFRGGVSISLAVADTVPVKEVEAALAQADERYKDSRVTYKGSAAAGNKLLEIVLPAAADGQVPHGADEDLRVTLSGILAPTFPALFEGIDERGGMIQEIGPLLGARFIKQAVFAMVAALVMIIIYITFRFELSYALGAVAALAHDVTICTGLFLIWNMGDRQISLPVIAALLTIIGYSLNDTIVVFDRVRENIGLLGKKLKFLEIINLSINQTLSRTVLTSITTLIVVLTLYFVGGGAINDFALIMLLGVIVGTYSSVFIATPVMILWHQRQEAKGATGVQATAGAAKTTA
jgi:SecD/SecF fusion protein